MDERRRVMFVVSPPALSIQQLLAALAHDMKNPLAALSTNLHFVCEAADMVNAERDEALDDSRVVSEQLDLLLRNLELFARGEAPSSRTLPIVLGNLVDEAVRRVDRLARAAEVVLDKRPHSRPVRAVGDGDLVGRALENCLLNAIEHAPRHGSIVIEVLADGHPRVAVTATRTRSFTLFDGGDVAGHRPQTVYGRGLSLLCADMAARAGGARLELSRLPGDAAEMLVITPARG